MIWKLIYFDSAMLLIDSLVITYLRSFLLDFLRVKKSRNAAKKVYKSQTWWERIILSFIKAHLQKFIKEFTFFHRIYVTVIYTLIPQYVILIVSNVLLEMKSMYFLAFFAIVKNIIFFLVWINIDSNKVSIYRKK